MMMMMIMMSVGGSSSSKSIYLRRERDVQSKIISYSAMGAVHKISGLILLHIITHTTGSIKHCFC